MKRPALVLALSLVVMWAARSTYAQTGPLVAFVGDTSIGTSSLVDVGPTGLTTLGTIFRSLGARVETIDLDRPIADDVQLVVIVRPVKPLSISNTARLWVYLRSGRNLLLAADPENTYLGFLNAKTGVTTSGLSTLLDRDYGILVQNALVVEPEYTETSLRAVQNSIAPVSLDAVPNLVTSPLMPFALPVFMWGARPLRVEPLGIDSFGVPLLESDNVYGETSPDVYPTGTGSRVVEPKAPLQVNIGTDLQGRLNIAAFAQNTATNSRIAVLGDSEMLQNGYGLAVDGTMPRYLGNRILAERLAAWLLDKPANQYPPLPQAFTWIAIDGKADDWPDSATTVADPSGDVPDPAGDIQQVRVLRDNLFVYFLIKTASAPEADAQIRIASSSQTVNASAGQVTLDDGTALASAAMSIGQVIEVRIPANKGTFTLQSICLASGDCLDAPLTVSPGKTVAPSAMQSESSGRLTVTTTARANLRSGPGTGFAAVRSVPSGTDLNALAQTADGSWIQVADDVGTGWVLASLVHAETNLAALPILTTP